MNFGCASFITSSQPVTRPRVPEVTIAQGAPRVSRWESKAREPGISVASEPWSLGIWASAAQTSGWGRWLVRVWFGLVVAKEI